MLIKKGKRDSGSTRQAAVTILTPLTAGTSFQNENNAATAATTEEVGSTTLAAARHTQRANKERARTTAGILRSVTKESIAVATNREAITTVQESTEKITNGSVTSNTAVAKDDTTAATRA